MRWPQAGQAERGTTRLHLFGGRRRRARQLRAFGAPLPLQHARQAVDDDVQEAADDEPDQDAPATNSQGAAWKTSSIVIAGKA